MIDERLNQSLIQMGYQSMDTNTTGIRVFYKTEESTVTIISMMNVLNGDELIPKQYEHILNQIKDKFIGADTPNVQLLSLVITRNPDKAKYLFRETVQDGHWIIDLVSGRLMVYETQAGDFTAVMNMVEEQLKEENLSVHPSNGAENRPFTLFNTSIIIINIITFILVQFTPIFGGENNAFLKGALSWYYVINQKQYYRLITSMFMHMDGSHLLNNMFIMLFIGANLERAIGRFKYLFIYFGTGILAGLTSIGYNMWKENGNFVLGNSVMAIGASGAIFGLVGAVLAIVIRNKGRLEQISTRQMIIFVVLTLYGGIVNARIDQAAHIGGFLAGILLAFLLYRRSQSKSKA